MKNGMKKLSRITIVTTGTPMVIEQIKHQLDRMVPVYRVVDMTITGRSMRRMFRTAQVRGSASPMTSFSPGNSRLRSCVRI